jgi:protein-disulfide isomerase
MFPIIKQVQGHFGNQLCFVFRNFPMDEIYPNAESAAGAAEFAGTQGKFWEMHDLLFQDQGRLSGNLYSELVEGLGLSPADLRSSLTYGTHKARVLADFNGGLRSGVSGTPTFFINGRLHYRLFEYENLVLALDKALGNVGNQGRFASWHAKLSSLRPQWKWE